MTSSIRLAALLVFSLVVPASGEEKVGGFVVGDTEMRRSHFSAAHGQGYSYPSHLAPRSWAWHAEGAERAHGYSYGSHGGYGYTPQRTYDARRWFTKRRYQRDRYFRDRRYKDQRY